MDVERVTPRAARTATPGAPVAGRPAPAPHAGAGRPVLPPLDRPPMIPSLADRLLADALARAEADFAARAEATASAAAGP
jgi:hypothetical protein